MAELFFDDCAIPGQADLVEYRQSPHRIRGALCADFFTILVDLRKSPGELLGAMGKTTRYKIKRAQERDGLTYQDGLEHSEEALVDFCSFYDRFAATKELLPTTLERLQLLDQSGLLALSRVIGSEEDHLVWHAHIRTRERARLLHSASLERSSLVGRANRYLHWMDMMAFRKEGIAVYDFGGWYQGLEDEAKLGINRFKEEFGGQIVREYNCSKPRTVKGALLLAYRTCRARIGV